MNKTIITMLLITLITVSAFAQGNTDTSPVRIGILPDVDSLPIQLAQRDGLYASEGSAVELISFRSPVERDAAFQAGELDGMVGDTLGAFFLREAGYDILITSITNGRYGLAANPLEGATQLSDLAGREIAVSRNTIIEYVADSLMGYSLGNDGDTEDPGQDGDAYQREYRRRMSARAPVLHRRFQWGSSACRQHPAAGGTRSDDLHTGSGQRTQ